MRRKLRVFISFLLVVSILLPLNVYSPPSEVKAAIGGAFGDSVGLIPGGSTGGGVVNMGSSALLRVSVKLDTKEGWYTGYEEIYPANDTYGILLGGSGNTVKTLSVLAPTASELGAYVESDNVFYGDNAYPSGARGALANAIWEMFMGHKGGQSYTGVFTEWMPSEGNPIQWTQFIGKEVFSQLGLSGENLALLEKTSSARISLKDRESITDPEEENQVIMGGLIIAAYMKERGQNIDLNEVAGALTGTNDKVLVVCLENMYAFNEIYDNPDKGYIYVLPWHLVQYVSGRKLDYSLLAGTAKQMAEKCLANAGVGYSEISGNGAIGFRVVEQGNPVKQALNQLFSPNLAFKGLARQMWYFRAERFDKITGLRLWTEDFISTGGEQGNTDYSFAPWNLYILMGFVPATAAPPTPGVGEHKLYSVPEFISTELNTTVQAKQHIDWTQSETSINGIVSALQVAHSNIDFSVPRKMTLVLKDISYTVTKSGAEDIGYQHEPSDQKYPLDIEIPLTQWETDTYIPRNWEEIEEDIINAIKSFDTKWGVSVTEGRFSSPGSYLWQYDSTAKLNWSVIGGSYLDKDYKPEPVDMGESHAETVIEVKPVDNLLLRWYNQPVAFAEVKQGTYSDNRDTEYWEAMAGAPTTETFYINAGGTPVYIDITAFKKQYSWSRVYKGTETARCPGHGHDPRTYCKIKTSDTKIGYKKHEGDYISIETITYRAAEQAVLDNIEIFKAGQEFVPISKGVQIEDNGSILYTRTFGTADSHNYGCSDGKENAPEGHTSVTCQNANGWNAVEAAIAADTETVFSQNDEVKIKIEGEEYTVVLRNFMSAPANEDSTLYHDVSEFLPIGENWDKTTKIPVVGYKGEPEAAGNRNTGSKAVSETLRFYKENVEVPLYQVNGIYTFDALLDQNIMEYSDMRVLLQNTQSNPPSPSFPDEYPIRLEYTDYKMTDSSYTEDSTNHKGPNPVVFHDPVSAQQVWIHDISEDILKDQRIVAGVKEMVVHQNVTDENAPSRQYIDYDFKVSFRNGGSFGKDYDGDVAVDKKGLLNVNESPPGTRGGGTDWGFQGESNVLLSEAPRSLTYPNETDAANTYMDVSKWINAKYIKFDNVNVRYEGDGQYYPMGTWIKLYDDNGQVKTGDPTEFLFHVTSNTKDAANAVTHFAVEAINAPETIRSMTDMNARGAAVYSDAEGVPANSHRKDKGYVSLNGNKVTVSAASSASNTRLSDIIGRIGNIIVDDTSDPMWANVFWKAATGWLIPNVIHKPDTNTPVSRFFSVPFGLFEETGSSNSRFNNRWNTLEEYHDASNTRLGRLPVNSAENTSFLYDVLGLRTASIKMGYTAQFSVQTLGDYDHEMKVIPSYDLAEEFPNASNGFKFFVPSTNGGTTTLVEYYNSEASDPYDYKPKIRFTLSHSLKNPRAKIDTAEKDTPEYQKASRTDTVIIGTPSMITIPQALRTWIGAVDTVGKVGSTSWSEGATHQTGSVSVGGAEGTRVGAESDPEGTYSNAHRWHGRIGLPSSTMVGTLNPDGSVYQFIDKNFRQYIIIYLTFRTNGGNGLWDLTTTTNTTTNPDGSPSYHFEIPDEPKQNPPSTNVPGDPGEPPFEKPKTPIIVVNYSNDSSTDAEVVGTH